jgi:hypothetical protein
MTDLETLLRKAQDRLRAPVSSRPERFHSWWDRHRWVGAVAGIVLLLLAAVVIVAAVADFVARG